MSMSWPTKVMYVCVCLRICGLRGLGEKDRRVTRWGGEGYFTFRYTELAQDQICMHFSLEGESEKMPRL